MIILGINEGSHDASVTLLDGANILFAGHAERYSKKKNDWFVNQDLMTEALSYGLPDQIAYYENPLLKTSRLLLKGGHGTKALSYKAPGLEHVPTQTFTHHHSHAAAGYYTSPFKDAVVVVLDAIGEWETSSIWIGEGDNLKQVKSQKYPFSFGLFYSAFTQLVGLKPNEEEYIMMGMAAYGDKQRYLRKVTEYFPSTTKQKYNFHKGIYDWSEELDPQAKFDIAAAVQAVYEARLLEFMKKAIELTGKRNLIFMGGCALNCAANTQLWDLFEDIWIMPNPGDAGSSLGAAAALRGKHVIWAGPYLGHDLGGKYPVTDIVNKLYRDKIAAVATGKAEYGPRALGNRSILADPRDPNIKDKVNMIKKRELFRPFAPVVMEEWASDWFDMPTSSTPYMQYAVKCLRPEEIPSVVHADGTSRVQTVNESQHPGLYAVLSRFYNQTGVPLLLNTSLNIKGQPLLNDSSDILAWETAYSHPIIS